MHFVVLHYICLIRIEIYSEKPIGSLWVIENILLKLWRDLSLPVGACILALTFMKMSLSIAQICPCYLCQEAAWDCSFGIFTCVCLAFIEHKKSNKALHSKASWKLLSYFFAHPHLTYLVIGDEGQAFWTDPGIQSLSSCPNLHIYKDQKAENWIPATSVYTHSHLEIFENTMWETYRENMKINKGDCGSQNNTSGLNNSTLVLWSINSTHCITVPPKICYCPHTLNMEQ